MFKKSYQTIFVIAFLLLGSTAKARVYFNQRVGHYQESYHLAEHKGQSFLSFMKKSLYPAIKKEADNPCFSKHIACVAKGEGVELRLADDVSTYHVRYKKIGEEKAERSGRSFGAVGFGNRVEYVADASYKHFLSTLEEVLEDKEQSQLFYSAILKILLNSDPSGIAHLNEDTKRVASDFVAMYVAEQYRRMIKGGGQWLASFPEWDNAHLHVTLLANFHAGQFNPGMYYHGEYTTDVYDQIDRVDGDSVCAYRNQDDSRVNRLDTRAFNLTDYWQFNSECDRSGVNITRRDFSRMSRNITRALNDLGYESELSAIYFSSDREIGTRHNINDQMADFIISDDAPEVFENADELADAIVTYLMLARENANQITDSL